MQILSKNPFQPHTLLVKDLKEGATFILSSQSTFESPTVFILIAKESRHPEDGPLGHCFALGVADGPQYHSLHLDLAVVKVKLRRVEIELLPWQQEEP